MFTIYKPHLLKKMTKVSYKATEPAGERKIVVSVRRAGLSKLALRLQRYQHLVTKRCDGSPRNVSV